MNSERLVLITDDNEMKRYLATTTYTTLVGRATETTRQQLEHIGWIRLLMTTSFNPAVSLFIWRPTALVIVRETSDPKRLTFSRSAINNLFPS